MLLSRQTCLCFNNYWLDWLSISNGTTQGCPLSMIFYALYNAPLLLTVHPNSASEISIGFVNDTMFLAIAQSLKEAHRILVDMMEHAQGSFNWS
ncbi:hypothetical protein J132_02015 [Termitomyces sp. J132]|nr:hypothetical protein J132_02015 [Termitomyces sp. J132]